MKIFNTTNLGFMSDKSTTSNKGRRIFSRGLYVSTTYTSNIENIKINISSGGEGAIEIEWWECMHTNTSNTGTWFWQGDAGYYFNSSAGVSERFSNTRYQQGQNNGVGAWNYSTGYIRRFATTNAYPQYISLMLIVSCNNWDRISVTYP